MSKRFILPTTVAVVSSEEEEIEGVVCVRAGQSIEDAVKNMEAKKAPKPAAPKPEPKKPETKLVKTKPTESSEKKA